ncbi:MAG: alpha/beta hydrolase [Nocardioides sp.]|nr:alpha/beta hydrolase [Nocardioides sp.]
MPSPQARLLAAGLRAVPDRLIAFALTHPPRSRWPSLVPPWLDSAYRVDVTTVEAGRVATASSRSEESPRHVLYLHGGAYTLGPAHWDAVRPLLERGWTVSMVDYPLAPEHTVADTVTMTLAAWQLTTATTAVPVDIMGDSAGGGLALVLLQHIRDLGLTRAGRTVLFSPWVDLVMDDAVTIAADRHDPFLSLRGLRGAALMYAGGRDLADPVLSPINGDLADLGSIQAWVGTREMFLAQCCRLADLTLPASGTDLELHIADGMIHDWPMLPVPEARRTLDEAVRFLA